MENKNFTSKIYSIQYMRAICAFGVALHHIDFFYNKGLQLNFGVHIFFMISSFLVMYTTQKGNQKFIRKRLLRIVPLYYAVTIATFAVAFAFPRLVPYDVTFKDLIYSLLFIPYSRAGGREASTIRPIVGPGWTLNYEIFFVLIFAMAMKISHKYRGIIAAGTCITLMILGFYVDKAESVPTLLVFATRTHLADFIAGILLFYILKWCYDNKYLFLSKIRIILYIITFACICILCINKLPEPKWLIAVILCFVALLCFILADMDKKENKIMSFLGNISFSFYLFHYYIITIVGKFFDLNVFNFYFVLALILIFAISIGLSYISWYFIETKFINYMKTKLKL